MEYAQNIYAQLGGNRFRVMTGATNFIKDDSKRKLSMKIGKNAKKVTHVSITLNDSDLYDIVFMNIRGMQPVKVLGEFENVYVENMREIFEEQTGMYLTL